MAQLQDILDDSTSRTLLIRMIMRYAELHKFEIRPVSEWPDCELTDQLENQVNVIPLDSWDDFILGNIYTVKHRVDVEELDIFLDQLYEGNLHSQFFK